MLNEDPPHRLPSPPQRGTSRSPDAEASTPPEIDQVDSPAIRFAEEYIQTLNAGQAYKAVHPEVADSTAYTQAFKMLQRDDVKLYIDRRMQQIRALRQAERERVLREMERIAFASIGDFLEITVDEGGVRHLRLKATGELTPQHMAAIKSLHQGKNGEIKLVLHDKVPALVRLGEMYALWGVHQLPPDDTPAGFYTREELLKMPFQKLRQIAARYEVLNRE